MRISVITTDHNLRIDIMITSHKEYHELNKKFRNDTKAKRLKFLLELERDFGRNKIFNLYYFRIKDGVNSKKRGRKTRFKTIKEIKNILKGKSKRP